MFIYLLYVNGSLKQVFTCLQNANKYVVKNKISNYTIEQMWAI